MAILENVFERFTSPGHHASRRSWRKPPTPFREIACGQQSLLPQGGKVGRVVLEAGHAGPCYTIRKSVGRPITKVHVTLGERQGRVEGPLWFILLYALRITQAQRKRSQQQRVIAVDSRAETTTRLDLSDLCFVDDLVSLLIFWRKS